MFLLPESCDAARINKEGVNLGLIYLLNNLSSACENTDTGLVFLDTLSAVLFPCMLFVGILKIPFRLGVIVHVMFNMRSMQANNP